MKTPENPVRKHSKRFCLKMQKFGFNVWEFQFWVPSVKTWSCLPPSPESSSRQSAARVTECSSRTFPEPRKQNQELLVFPGLLSLWFKNLVHREAGVEFRGHWAKSFIRIKKKKLTIVSNFTVFFFAFVFMKSGFSCITFFCAVDASLSAKCIISVCLFVLLYLCLKWKQAENQNLWEFSKNLSLMAETWPGSKFERNFEFEKKKKKKESDQDKNKLMYNCFLTF